MKLKELWIMHYSVIYLLPTHRVAIILPIVCVLTSMYGGLAIFAAIGHMAHSLGTDNVESFLRNGPGLIFVVYPEALSQMVGAPAWTALFFVMVLTVGLDTQVCNFWFTLPWFCLG